MCSDSRKEFFGNGFFDWQFSNAEDQAVWDARQFDPEKYWGEFPRDIPSKEDYSLPDWAPAYFTKYKGNPVLGPSETGWDCGHSSGGVHNGSIIRRDGRYYYVYRGEGPLPVHDFGVDSINGIRYVCDIGIAESDDGIHFTKTTPEAGLFRHGSDLLYSFEDVCLVTYQGKYYLFCNRWDWNTIATPGTGGVWLAVSDDLHTWEKKGLLFPGAGVTHRNAAVVQNPHNEAVKINGKFVMYLNDGIVAYSNDLITWESSRIANLWPGGEGCFALTDHCASRPDDILLFTGGHHTGHFYAIGAVLLSRQDPATAKDVCLRPLISADPDIPWEAGLSADGGSAVSCWRDTIFFTGMTLQDDGTYLICYGGSEYYTCLATTRFACT
ncbi:MAG: hypothetical protein ACYC5K_09525 [Saccharofermentanales bacterium]